MAPVIAMSFSSLPTLHGPELRDVPSSPEWRHVCECVKDLRSRRFAAMRESGIALKFLDCNNIEIATSVGLQVKQWLHCGDRAGPSLVLLAPRPIWLLSVAMRKLSTSVCIAI